MTEPQRCANTPAAPNHHPLIGVRMAEKKCNKCLVTKPLDSFYPHPDGKFGRRPDCKACHNARSTAYRISNVEKVRAMKRLHRLKNLDALKARDRAYYQKNRERWRVYEKAVKADPVLRQRQYDAINRWRKRNKEQVNVWTRNRRSLLKRLEGSHTKQDIVELLAEQVGLCAYCSCDISFGYHVDHIIPVSKMGRNDKSNLQLLCKKCNLSKNNKVTEKEKQNGRYSAVSSSVEHHSSK
jgi:5-methylcytosine-specific restriction endonuclease McrA